MKLTINIDSENEACRTRNDLADIVRRLASKIGHAESYSTHPIRDANGNTVGSFFMSEEDSDEEDEIDPDDYWKDPTDEDIDGYREGDIDDIF